MTRPKTTKRAHPASTAKVQRWIDLVAGLLARSTPATFEELAKVVPQYLDHVQAAKREHEPVRRRTKLASVKRTFERDKDELRRFGVLVQTLPDPEDGQDAATYRLRTTEFYLPYLCLASPTRGKAAPRRVDRHGYRALSSLALAPDELQAVVDAATVASTLGDPVLHREVASALRKLAVDLPVDAVRPRDDEPHQLLPRARASLETFDALGDAVRRRRAVRFIYEAPTAGSPVPRHVEPWGLFFVGGHWYLAAHDRDRLARRNFRLNRISGVRVDDIAAGTPDVVVPADFDLRDLARARLAWELGEGDEERVIIEFRDTTGAELASQHYGRPVDGWPRRRALMVRRWDPLVRWILSFAGGVVPVSPASLVTRCQEVLATTRARYVDPPAVLPHPSAPRPVGHAKSWHPTTAAEQLRRILHVIPLLADGAPHPISHVARAAGTTVEILRDDLYSLVTRYDLPGGFVDGVQLYFDAKEVSVVTNHFLRPMRLTAAELCALELGLAVLRHRRPPDEHTVLDRARARLREVILRLPDDPLALTAGSIAVGDPPVSAPVRVIREALRQRRKVVLRYRGSGRSQSGERTVHPRTLIVSHGALYLVAWCEVAADMRTFRLDRVESATLLDASVDHEPVIDLEHWVGTGKVFRGESMEVMQVWYAPSVAPWIAEREGRLVNTDGSLVLEHPVADREWAWRHLLQYGDGAEILAPPELRAALDTKLAEMSGALAESSRGQDSHQVPVRMEE